MTNLENMPTLKNIKSYTQLKLKYQNIDTKIWFPNS